MVLASYSIRPRYKQVKSTVSKQYFLHGLLDSYMYSDPAGAHALFSETLSPGTVEFY